MLGEEVFEFADGGAGAAGDADHPARLVDEDAAVGVEFGGCHAVADADHAAEFGGAFGVVESARHRGEAGDHAGHLGEGSHLHDVG